VVCIYKFGSKTLSLITVSCHTQHHDSWMPTYFSSILNWNQQNDLGWGGGGVGRWVGCNHKLKIIMSCIIITWGRLLISSIYLLNQSISIVFLALNLHSSFPNLAYYNIAHSMKLAHVLSVHISPFNAFWNLYLLPLPIPVLLLAWWWHCC
jgi:hypothetical protein